MKIDKSKTVAFTGHRKIPTGDELEKLKQRIVAEIEKSIEDGYDTFINGCASGFDLLVLQILINKKRIVYLRDYRPIKVIAAVPYEHQAEKYSIREHELYYTLLPMCNDVITLSVRYHKDCYKDRNQYMVDNSSKLISYWDGSFRSGTAQTVRMAERQSIEIINLYKD